MRAVIGLSLVLALGCGGAGGPAAEIEQTEFDAGLNVDLAASTRLANGSYVRDLELGGGSEVTQGELISVKYDGWLPDGERFDGTRDGGVFTFNYGQRQVITGWDQGLGGVRRGGTRQLILPPTLAYGVPNGAPPAVPPNSVVVFSLQLQEVTTGSAPSPCGCSTDALTAPLLGLLGVAFALRRRRA